MLVKFTLDRDCFSAQAFNDELNTNSHLVLEEYWSKYGVLIYPEKFNKLEFLNGLQCSKDKQKWSLKLNGNLFRSFEVCENWESMEEQNTKEPKYKNLLEYKKYFQALIVDETNYLEVKSHEQFSTINVELEILPPGLIGDSTKFTFVKKRLELPYLDIDEITDNIWQDRFSDLCKYSKEITIIDRYFFKSLATDFKNKKQSSFEFFLKKLSNFRHDKCILTIVSTTTTSDNDKSYDELFSGISSNGEYLDWHDFLFSRSNAILSPPLKTHINSLKFIDVNHAFFRKESHDRYLRFDNCFFQIGKGMDFMRFEKQATRNACSYKYDRQFIRNMVFNEVPNYDHREFCLI